MNVQQRIHVDIAGQAPLLVLMLLGGGYPPPMGGGM
jgi:hypothetical protein